MVYLNRSVAEKLEEEKQIVNKSIQELALLELTKNARILQRQLKLMKGMQLKKQQLELVKEIINNLEKEFNLFKI